MRAGLFCDSRERLSEALDQVRQKTSSNMASTSTLTAPRMSLSGMPVKESLMPQVKAWRARGRLLPLGIDITATLLEISTQK